MAERPYMPMASLQDKIDEMQKTIKKYKECKRRSTSGSPDKVFISRDRYGFKCKDGNVSAKLRRYHQTETLELGRNSKWLKMISYWDDYIGTAKFAERVYKGIPDSVRGYVWARLLSVPTSLANNQGKYQSMKDKLPMVARPGVIEQIKKDIARTFCSNVVFKSDYGVKKQQLFFVLATYSTYNSQLGYTQGMSEMAAVFLMYMGEEEAFWALTSFISGDLSMHGFLIHSFPKLKRFQAHHEAVLKKMIPKVYNHLEMGDLRSIYNLEWFMMAYLRLPFSLCLRIWDVFLLRGEEVLVGMAYTIVKKLEDKILEQNLDYLLMFFNPLEKHSIFQPEEEENMMSSLKSNINALTKHLLHLPPPPTDSSEMSYHNPEMVKDKKLNSLLFSPVPVNEPPKRFGFLKGGLTGLTSKFSKKGGGDASKNNNKSNNNNNNKSNRSFNKNNNKSNRISNKKILTSKIRNDKYNHSNNKDRNTAFQDQRC